jgi:hypothetical protein
MNVTECGKNLVYIKIDVKNLSWTSNGMEHTAEPNTGDMHITIGTYDITPDPDRRKANTAVKVQKLLMNRTISNQLLLQQGGGRVLMKAKHNEDCDGTPVILDILHAELMPMILHTVETRYSSIFKPTRGHPRRMIGSSSTIFHLSIYAQSFSVVSRPVHKMF